VKKHCLAGKIKKQTHYEIDNEGDCCKSSCHVKLFLCCTDLRFFNKSKNFDLEIFEAHASLYADSLFQVLR
jgi:hypothetical protein